MNVTVQQKFEWFSLVTPKEITLHYITLQLKFAIASLTTDKVQRCITKHK